MDDGMAPWDELPYFQAPVFSKVSLAPGVVSTINTPDPQCVLLVLSFSPLSSGGNPIIWPSSQVGTSTGIVLSTSDTSLTIDYRTYGPLTTLQWYATVWSGSGSTVSCISVSLAKWPIQTRSGQGRSGNSGIQSSIDALHKRMTDLLNKQSSMQRVLDLVTQGQMR